MSEASGDLAACSALSGNHEQRCADRRLQLRRRTSADLSLILPSFLSPQGKASASPSSLQDRSITTLYMIPTVACSLGEPPMEWTPGLNPGVTERKKDVESRTIWDDGFRRLAPKSSFRPPPARRQASAGIQLRGAPRNAVKTGSRIVRRVARMGIPITSTAACPG